jgi:hypothetical protein
MSFVRPSLGNIVFVISLNVTPRPLIRPGTLGFGGIYIASSTGIHAPTRELAWRGVRGAEAPAGALAEEPLVPR